MIVTIDRHAGFCWGVIRAIDFAEKELAKNGIVYCLGDIIHNTAEVTRLSNAGMKTITVEDFEKIPDFSKVLIRAHGEPPATYALALKNNIELIDATCPVVTKVQERVKRFVDDNFQVVIYGKPNHAEVIGINGVTGNTALVIESIEEGLTKIEFDRPTVLFSQTTMDKSNFKILADKLRMKVNKLIVDTIENAAVEFHAKDTICGQVSGREKKLKLFATENDVIIFVSGKKSSNGKVLYEIAKSANSSTYFVELKEDIDFTWIENANKIGITGATSTPQWLMNDIQLFIESKCI